MTPPTREAYLSAPLPIERELRALLHPDDVRVVFDVGACEGEDSIRYSRLFPKAVVYAVEPLPQNLPLIEANLKRHPTGRIHVLTLALADARGTSRFYVSSGQPEGALASDDWDYGNKSSSLLPPARHVQIHPWVHFEDAIEVAADTLSNVCRERSVTEIDLVHLDVQGAELKVLEGAGPLIDRIKVIWLEVEAIALYEGQPLKADVERFMFHHSFRKLVDRVDAVSGDQLWVNEALVTIPLSLRVRGSTLFRVASGLRHRLAHSLRRLQSGMIPTRNPRPGAAVARRRRGRHVYDARVAGDKIRASFGMAVTR